MMIADTSGDLDDGHQHAVNTYMLNEAQRPMSQTLWGRNTYCKDEATCLTWGYRLLHLVGKGHSGMSRVYQAAKVEEGGAVGDLTLDSQVTIKVMKSENSLSQYLLHSVLAMRQKLPPHTNILHTTDYFSDARAEFIVSQTCRLGSLETLLNQKQFVGKGMAELSSRHIITQVCSGLSHLKAIGIPHGQLTCHNILLSDKYHVKLCDYGFPPSACSIIQHPSSTTQTAFKAPEVLQDIVHDDFIPDIWSLGVVMYVTLHGVLPFTNKELKIAEHHNLPALCLRSSLSLACGRLLRNLLTYSAVIRPDLSQVLQDDWLCDGASMFPYRTVRVLPNHCAEPTLILKRQVQFTMPKVKSLLDGHKPEATRREKCQCQEEGTLGLSKVRAAIKSKEIHARYQRAQKLIS